MNEQLRENLSANGRDASPQAAVEQDADQSSTAADPTGEQTGNPAVDQVLSRLAELDEIPIDQHVEVFESAHGSLRRALDGAEGGIDQMPRPGH